ncbi:hypothetical protein YB2330_003180 [Saitoella coloradoensis]
MSSQKKILFVLTSHNKIDKLDKPTGWYLPEVAHPYYVLAPHYSITWASPAGGEAPLDPGSVEAFKDDEEAQKFLKEVNDWKQCRKLSDVLPEVEKGEYVAVFYPGGHGPMYDLPRDEQSLKILESFWKQNLPVSAVCHAPAVLAETSFVKGRKVTGFSNEEEDQAGLTDAMPYLLEDRLKERGGLYEKAEKAWGEKLVVDGKLITGQNPASAKAVGEALHQMITGGAPEDESKASEQDKLAGMGAS